jgi:hypothetical protein
MFSNTHPAGATVRAGLLAAGLSSLGRVAGHQVGCGVFSYMHGAMVRRKTVAYQ